MFMLRFENGIISYTIILYSLISILIIQFQKQYERSRRFYHFYSGLK